MDQRQSVNITIITCCYDRPLVFRLFLKWFMFLREKLAEKNIDLFIYCGGSVADDAGANKRIFHAITGGYGVWVECKNEPLGEKWNAVLKKSQERPTDWFLILGSDDFLSLKTFDIYLKYTGEYNYLAFNDLSFLDIYSKQVKHWQGFVTERIGDSVGAGRLISTYLVSRCNYHLWVDSLNSGLDMSCNKLLDTVIGVRKKVVSFLEEGGYNLDIKSNVNLWKYSSFGGDIQEGIPNEHYPSDFIEYVDYLNDLFNEKDSTVIDFNLLKTDSTYSLSSNESDYNAEYMPEKIIINPAVKPYHKIEILIITIKDRKPQFVRLYHELKRQIKEANLEGVVDILFIRDEGEKSIGEKRNYLYQISNAEYCLSFDDDDWPSPTFVKDIYEASKSGADCITFQVELNTGKKRVPYIFGLEYKEYRFDGMKYLRPPGHICAIKSSIAKKYRFKELPKPVDRGTDVSWALELVRNNALKTETKINKTLYIYNRKF